MNIIQADPRSLIPYAFNNRKHGDQQVDRIANSIREFGFNQPVVIDETNTVLVGHGRLAAALKLGLDKVPVLQVLGLTEAKKKAYRILDNKLQNDSEWDFANVELELAHLEDLGFELEPWGLEELLALAPEDQKEAHEDAGPGEFPEEPFIKKGDLLEMGKHRVLCGDSTSAEEVTTLMADVVANMIITDPPYGVSYVGKTKEALEIENDDLNEEELATMWTSTLDAWLTRLIAGGAFYAAVPPGPLRQIFSGELKDRGILRQELVWEKDSMVLGRSDYHYKHEPILYGWKPGAAHYFTDDRTKTDVLVRDRPKASKEHPTMKPVLLWADLISNSSKEGWIVADPFLGSGTTLIAADQLGRVCYGMEISPKYCQVILERYIKYCADSGKDAQVKINGEPFNPAEL